MRTIPTGLLKPILFGLNLFLAEAAQPQLSITILHSFGGSADGQEPYAGLVQGGDGALYGTTFQGGANNAGVVFKVNPDGSGNGPIYSLESNRVSPGGLSNPSGLIQTTGGAMYGTSGHGTNGDGSVFRINPDGTGYAVLYSFDHTFGGAYSPTAALIQGRDSFLYGTTQFGGILGDGCVFRISTNGTGFTVLHQFGSAGEVKRPQSPLIQGLDGALYGTTTAGGTSAQGGASGFGTVFKLNTDGTGEAVLHNFTGNDGLYPYTAGLLQGKDGLLYGTTQQGGSVGGGTVFKLNPDGTGFVTLHNFGESPADGQYPNSAMAQGNDGALYGTTEMGGISSFGVMFRLNTDGTRYEVLYQFGVKPGDGKNPGAPLVRAADGGLFGTTKFGGANNLGAVFRLAPSPPFLAALVPLPDKTVRLTVTAASNFVFRIEGSSDHAHWVTLTNLVNTSGAVQFVDSGASNAPHRFYRAAWVP